MISTHDLSVGYSPLTHPLLDKIDITLSDGECTLLCGANGSGKSTLMKTLCGTIKPLGGHFEKQGEVIMLPTGIPKLAGFTLADMVRTMLLKESSWTGRLSSRARDAALQCMELLSLTDIRDRDLSELSDGQFQKGCIAGGLCALMLRGKGRGGTLLLDEPTAFLDVEGKDSVLSSLEVASASLGSAILLSSHDIITASKHCRSIIGITPGKTVLQSGPSPEDKIKTLQETFPAVAIHL